jgi:hypothetical protein
MGGRSPDEVEPVTAESEPEPGKQATLGQQNSCADQAHAKFVEDGYTSQFVRGTRDIQHAGYTDHYDAQTNVCYIEVTTVTTVEAKHNALLGSYLIYDAFEGQVYARMTIVLFGGSPSISFTTRDPSECWVMPIGQPTIKCSIEDNAEFKVLVKKHFGM